MLPVVPYHLTDADPAPAAVRVLTFVPFLPDGRCVALPGPRLPSGEVRPDEHWLLDASLRIPLETVAFRRQRVHPFAADGDHVYVWLDGDRYSGRRPHAGIEPHIAAPEPLAAALDPVDARVLRDAAHSLRAQSDADYYAGNLRLLEPAYLRGTTPQHGSGFSGDAIRWRRRRGMIVDGIHRCGTLVDLGCANGLLMESIHRWAAERGHTIEPYGVDISPGLVDLARRRLPHWAGRIQVGNAISYRPAAPPHRFTFVHLLIDLVPRARRRDLIDHALEHLVEPGGRLLVSHYQNDGGSDLSAAEHVGRLGLPVTGAAGTGSATTAWIDRP